MSGTATSFSFSILSEKLCLTAGDLAVGGTEFDNDTLVSLLFSLADSTGD